MLRVDIKFGMDIGAPTFILDTLKNCYILPFYSNLMSICLSNNLSALNYADFVKSAITD